MPNQAAVLEFEISCDLAQVRGAGERVGRFLAEQGCPLEAVMDCQLSVVEACNNAIQYAEPSARQRPVTVRVSCLSEEIEMRVIDHTPGFDWPSHAPAPEPEAERGRGVFLIQTLMDKTRYLHGEGDNTLVLLRHLGRP